MKKLVLIFFIAKSLFALDDADIYMFRHSISNYYYRFLDSSTSFLYDKSNYDYIKKHNKLKIYIDNSIDDDGDIKSSLSIRANIKLPKINNNLFLTIDKDSDNTLENDKISTLQEEKQNSRIGLKYFFLKNRDKNIYLKLGGRIRLSNTQIYLKLGLDKIQRYKHSNIYFYFNEYYYIKDNKLKSETGVDFKRKLSKKFNLSQLNNLTFDDSKFYMTNTILLDQYLNKRAIMSYWTTLYTIYDKSFEKDSMSFNLKYHYMLKEWIFIDMIPSLVKSFQDDKDTKAYLYVNFGFIF